MFGIVSSYHLIPGRSVEAVTSDARANSEGLVCLRGSGSGERTFAHAVRFFHFLHNNRDASDCVTTEAARHNPAAINSQNRISEDLTTQS